MSPEVYLDWNATTPPHPDVLAAMQAVAEAAWGNPSSVHASGRRASAVVETAREALAEWCGVDPRAVVLTSGATEANNLALRVAATLVTSRLEHPSVVRVAEALEREGRSVVWLPVPPSGCIDPEDVRAITRTLPDDFVVALMAANHETGVIQPIREVADIVHGRGGRLHVDAVQAAGKVPVSLWSAGDTLSIAAHKVRGPKGIGALVLRSPGLPRPLLLGGAQERGLRPGTVDPVGAAGFGAAARRLIEGGEGRYARLATLRDRLEAVVTRFGEVNGAGGARLPHVTNVSIDGWLGDELVAALDLAGVHVSAGSACSAGTSEPSAVIECMSGRRRAEGAIRFSLGEDTTSEDIEFAISVFTQVVSRQTSPR